MRAIIYGHCEVIRTREVLVEIQVSRLKGTNRFVLKMYKFLKGDLQTIVHYILNYKHPCNLFGEIITNTVSEF